MKIGILACGYNCHNGLEERLRPFMRPEFIISVVSAPFKDFPIEYRENESTIKCLSSLLRKNKIQWVYHSSDPLDEAETRNQALRPLLIKENVNYIWLLDLSDEVYTDKEVDNIIRFIHQRSETWYRINFKNYVFDKMTWIDGFCPARIWKTKYFTGRNWKLKGFYYDNDAVYVNEDGEELQDKQFSSSVIPKYLAQVKHYSWSDLERSKKKINYQESRGWSCSFKYNKKLNKIEFNKEYYAKSGQEIPELNYD